MNKQKLDFKRVIKISALFIITIANVNFLTIENKSATFGVLILVIFFSLYKNCSSKFKVKQIKNIVISIFTIFLIFSLNYFLNYIELFSITILFFKFFIYICFIGLLYNNLLEFYTDLYIVLKIIFIHSIVNFILCNIFGSLFNYIVLPNGYFTKSFSYLLYCGSYVQIGSLILYRNQGLFWEPGILQLFLNLYLFFSIFVYPKSRRTILLTILMILTTFSTTGYFIMTIIILSSILNIYKRNLLKLLASLFIVSVIIFPITIYNINEKFYGRNTSSSQHRIYDLIIAVKIIKMNPLEGIGFQPDAYVRYLKLHPELRNFNLKGNKHDTGNTNSIIMLLVYFGIPLSIFLLFLLFNQPLNKKVILFMIFFISLNSEPIIFSDLFICILSIGFLNISKSKSEFNVIKQ